MRPNLTDEVLEALPSAAEAEVYRALRSQLPDSVLVAGFPQFRPTQFPRLRTT